MHMITISQADKEDLEPICRLFNEYDKNVEEYFPKNHLRLLQKLHSEHGDNPERRKGILESIENPDEMFLVAKEDDAIVGCVVGWIEPPTGEGKFDQLIAANTANEGEVVRRLYDELENWFRAKECPYVVVNVVTNNPRKELYTDFGYEPVLEEMRKIIQ